MPVFILVKLAFRQNHQIPLQFYLLRHMAPVFILVTFGHAPNEEVVKAAQAVEAARSV